MRLFVVTIFEKIKTFSLWVWVALSMQHFLFENILILDNHFLNFLPFWFSMFNVHMVTISSNKSSFHSHYLCSDDGEDDHHCSILHCYIWTQVTDTYALTHELLIVSNTWVSFPSEVRDILSHVLLIHPRQLHWLPWTLSHCYCHTHPAASSSWIHHMLLMTFSLWHFTHVFHNLQRRNRLGNLAALKRILFDWIYGLRGQFIGIWKLGSS